jgi:hypothetical protein
LNRTAIQSACLIVLLAGFFLAQNNLFAQSSSTPDEMMSDLAVTESSSPSVQWYGITPGKTTAEEIKSSVDGIIEEKSLGEKVQFLLPPGIPQGDKRVKPAFGRVATVTCNKDGVVESINIGSFYREARPLFEELSAELDMEFVKVSPVSTYSSTSSVYKSTTQNVWMIVSNIARVNGKREVLALNYGSNLVRNELPVPKVPYKR